MTIVDMILFNENYEILYSLYADFQFFSQVYKGPIHQFYLKSFFFFFDDSLGKTLGWLVAWLKVIILSEGLIVTIT